MELESWQKELIKIMTQNKGKRVIQATSRQNGKSAFNHILHHFHNLYNAGPKELELSEGTVFGARYYTVEPKGHYWPELEAWAKQTYGEPAEIWEANNFIWPDCGRWYMNDSKFWFRNERDRTLFILKWSK